MNDSQEQSEIQSNPRSYTSPFECDVSSIIASQSWSRAKLKSALKDMKHPDEGPTGDVPLL